jgi:hypothetical protein
MVRVMIYIRVPDKSDAKTFMALAKSGTPVVCLPENTYGVREEHLKLLKRKRISFKKLEPSKVPVPKPAIAV